MAETKSKDEPTVTPPPQGVGLTPKPVDTKAELTNPKDVKLGVLKEPEHPADKTSAPGPYDLPIERPPFSTGRPDVPIVTSMVTGAGAHTPPDPEEFTPDGRPRNLPGSA